jgi:stage V sporulation protein B
LPSREEKVARQSFHSSVIVTAGNVSSMVFLAAGSIIVARLLGPQNFGLYSLVLSLPLFLQTLTGFGTKTAVNRHTAYYISKGDFATARRLTKNAIIFLLISSAIFTAVSFVLSGAMAATLLDRPTITIYVQVATLLIFGQPLFVFLTPAFVGWHEPLQDAIWTIAQAVLKLVISVVLILLGFGVFGALYGYVLGSLLAGVFGILVLYLQKLRGSSTMNEKKWSFADFVGDAKTMMWFGLPVYIGNTVLLLSQRLVVTVALAYIASNKIIGYYSAAGNVTQSILAISMGFNSAFFAAFASLDGMNSDTSMAFKYGVKYVSYFMMPLIVFIVATPSVFINAFYGRAYSQASFYLVYLALAYLPYAFGYSVLAPYINGTGNSKLNLFMDIAEALGTLVPAFILISWLRLGILGLLLTIMISNVAPTIYGLYATQKYLHASPDYVNLLRTSIVCIICYLILYPISSFLLRGVSVFISFPIELFIFTGVFLTLMPLIRAVQSEDINRLKLSSRGIKVVNRFLDLILGYENFLIEHFVKSNRPNLND